MKKSAIKVKAGVKAGGLALNHNKKALKVKAGVKAGGLALNHNGVLAVVCEGFSVNHNQSLLAV